MVKISAASSTPPLNLSSVFYQKYVIHGEQFNKSEGYKPDNIVGITPLPYP